MLTETQCKSIEAALVESVEPRRVAAYLCLHMGLTLAEVTALHQQDVDLEHGTIFIRSVMGKAEGAAAIRCLPSDMPRRLPIPPQARAFLRRHIDAYPSGGCFIASGTAEPLPFYRMQNLLTSLRAKCGLSEPLSVSDLRNAFIRRCIEAGMDLYSLCCYVGIRQPNVIFKRFEPFFKPRFDVPEALAPWGDTAAPEVKNAEPKRMNLLILGAGSQGPVVKEIAQAIGVFHDIAFLDDDPANTLAIGPLSDIAQLKDRFPMALPSFGDSRLRERWMDACEALGYVVPTLVHPSATVSPNAMLERSVVVEARCIVSAGAAIGRGALLSGAGVVEVGARVGQFAHVGSSVTVAKGAAVPDYLRLPSGTVYQKTK